MGSTPRSTATRRSRYAVAVGTLEELPRDLLRTRQRLGLVQREVAELAGVTRGSVSHVERGRLSHVSVPTLLDVLRWLDRAGGHTGDPDVVRR